MGNITGNNKPIDESSEEVLKRALKLLGFKELRGLDKNAYCGAPVGSVILDLEDKEEDKGLTLIFGDGALSIITMRGEEYLFRLEEV